MHSGRAAVPTCKLAPSVRIKILTMGEAGVGKSCLIKRYCERKFVERYISTIGVDYGVKSVKLKSREISVNFWDLAGQAEYLEIRNEFYKDTQAALLVFDVCSRQSFEKLNAWLKESTQFGAKPKVVVLCGNKVDLPGRVVSKLEASAWAVSKGFKYYETSAQNGENVDNVFELLFEMACSDQPGSHSTSRA